MAARVCDRWADRSKTISDSHVATRAPVFVSILSGQNVRCSVRQLGQREGGAVVAGNMDCSGDASSYDTQNTSEAF
jgi:hypothetical protein